MSMLRGTILTLLLASSALLTPGPVAAAICGFPGFVAVGGGGTAPPTPAGYIVLFDTVFPFAVTGIGTVPLGGAFADACMDIWRDSTLGPAPPNYSFVFGSAPSACATSTCTVGSAPTCFATFCGAFP